MLFNTIDFIIFFIIAITLIWIIKNRNFQHIFLLAASYFFFYYSSNYLIVLLVFTTLWDFYLGKAIWNAQNNDTKKILLILSLAGNLGLLGFFKYVDFAIAQFNLFGHYFNLNNEIPSLNIILPIGISFYTFHSITYTVGIYRGNLNPAKSITEYAIFVAFFPQLVAGPILRAKDFLPQLREKINNSTTMESLRKIVISKSNLKLGLTFMVLGFLKKILFADNISPMVNEIFGAPIGRDSFEIIIAAFAFGIQIYCDFSGYSDIAYGSATILGFKIPINFNKPYFAVSPSDFWRRWHISLSSWLRDYLYIPLGGNRVSTLRTYLNLFIVMFLGGLWHGASWNFVIWGLLHGAYLAINKAISHKIPSIASYSPIKIKLLTVCSILITQYFVFLAWIAFRVRDFNGMAYSIQKYVILDVKISGILPFVTSHKFPILLMATFVVLHYVSYRSRNMEEKISNYTLKYWLIFLIIIITFILLFYNGNPENFIYFQF